ncbi:MAG: hypothetical protein WDO15_23650 [Bacteroidota bacterium]
MNIKKLVAAGVLLAGATVVSAQSPFKVEYDFNLPVIAKVITVDASGNVYAAGTFDEPETVGSPLYLLSMVEMMSSFSSLIPVATFFGL